MKKLHITFDKLNPNIISIKFWDMIAHKKIYKCWDAELWEIAISYIDSKKFWEYIICNKSYLQWDKYCIYAYRNKLSQKIHIINNDFDNFITEKINQYEKESQESYLEDSFFCSKYLKYKTKYLALKKKLNL